jgi:hypothetical protein
MTVQTALFLVLLLACPLLMVWMHGRAGHGRSGAGGHACGQGGDERGRPEPSPTAEPAPPRAGGERRSG